MAVVGGLTTVYSHGTENRGKSIHWPAYSTKVHFMPVGNITTTVNKDRQIRPMSGIISLDVFYITAYHLGQNESLHLLLLKFTMSIIMKVENV